MTNHKFPLLALDPCNTYHKQNNRSHLQKALSTPVYLWTICHRLGIRLKIPKCSSFQRLRRPYILEKKHRTSDRLPLGLLTSSMTWFISVFLLLFCWDSITDAFLLLCIHSVLPYGLITYRPPLGLAILVSLRAPPLYTLQPFGQLTISTLVPFYSSAA